MRYILREIVFKCILKLRLGIKLKNNREEYMMKKGKKKVCSVISWILAVMLLMSTSYTSMTVSAKENKAPERTKITNVSVKKNKNLSVTYKKVAKVTKYEVQISTSRQFKKAVKCKKVKPQIKTVVFKNPGYGNYYIRVRSYRLVGKKKYYSSWSKVKKKEIRKNIIQKEETNNNKQKETIPPKKNFKDPENTSSDKNETKDESGSIDDKKEPDSESKDETSDDEKEKVTDINECTVRLYRANVTYDGTPKCPIVNVTTADGYYMYEGEDYTTEFFNNVNAGTASVQVTGIGKYTGKVTKTFEIAKSEYLGAQIENKDVKVGEEIKVHFSNNYDGERTYTVYKNYGREPEEEDAQVDEEGRLIAKKAADILLYVSVPETQNYCAQDRIYLGHVYIYDDTNPISGFFSFSAPVKTSDKEVVVSGSGITSFDMQFDSIASKKWFDGHMTFTVEDVTPKAYRDTFQRAGLNMQSPQITQIKDITQDLRQDYAYMQGVYTVQGPIDLHISEQYQCMTSRKIMITAGEGVRACKVCAYKDGELYDFVYITTKPYNEAGEYLDKKLYDDVRHKVESKLWTDSMSNYEKLKALATYINNTTHYPGYGCTEKETNPTLWNNFSVDGVGLYYDMFNMPTLNRVMDLQGGITTCVAIDIVEKAALEDLNLPYLYDSKTGTVAEGEGVWITASGYHESLIYKDSEGKKKYLDAQGMMKNDSCEEHDCLSKIVK